MGVLQAIAAFFCYTAAAILVVKYVDSVADVIGKWGIPIAIVLVVVAVAIFRQSPVNPIKK